MAKKGCKLHIKERHKEGQTYYQLYSGDKFVRHIGNAEKLRIFQRDTKLGQEAAELLKQKPYLDPKAALSIKAMARKEAVSKIVLTGKRYRAIVIDPPWPMEKILRDERPNQAEFDYPVMDIEEIKALPVKTLADGDGCHVYLWTTQRFLPTAFEVFEAWGISYQCLMTWIKNVGFTPFSWMYSTELCLFGRIGSLPLLKMGIRLDFNAKVREHSRKPEVFYGIVGQASPGPRLDMFSREKREGFDQWGNEIDKF